MTKILRKARREYFGARIDREPLNAEVKARMTSKEIRAVDLIAKQEQRSRSAILRKALDEYFGGRRVKREA